MDRRIFGLETEYGVACTSGGTRRLTPDEVARYLFRRVVTWGRSSNVFLRNGSRIYLDVGSHPEYATAECDDLVQLINHDRAGERILEDLIVDAEQRLASEGISGDIYLFKNNTDSHGNSYGCHENYLISRVGDFAKITDVLVPFLVSRQLICGAGKVLHTARGAEYSVSQRAEHIWEVVSSATTRSRPIINTRDEPHADPERYRRLHVIVGDSNMSETTTLLKVGSAELVLRLIEAGVPMRDFTLENPIRAIRDMSRDRTGRVKVALSNGRRISALELQTEYYEKVVEFVRREGLGTRVVDRVLDLWERTLRAVAEDKLALVDTEIDWAIKLKLLDRYAAKHKLELRRPADRAARSGVPRHPAIAGRVLPARGSAGWPPGSPPTRRSSGPRRCRRRPPGRSCAATSSGPPRRAARLHGRLGAPQAQRPGPAHRALQGPVRGHRRAGGPADRLDARLGALRRAQGAYVG